MKNPNTLQILKAGFLAGLLDILAAFANFYFKTGKNPVVVLKFIASGIFGRAAMSGGTEMMVLGLLLHFLIALLFAVFFFKIVSKILTANSGKLLTGVLYGLFIWLVMNLIVVPLSNAPKLPFDIQSAIVNATILVLCVGLPISYCYYNSIKSAK
jgi:hypothetical protein